MQTLIVRNAWETYASISRLNELPPNIQNAFRKAFYAGFVNGARILVDSVSTMTPNPASDLVMAIHQELETFDQLHKMQLI